MPLNKIQDLVDLADKFGVIDRLKGKLMKQPDPAAHELVIIMDEIAKVFLGLQQETMRLFSLHFDSENPKGNHEEVVILMEISSGGAGVNLGKVRGHCAKISNIYARYLSPWFSKIDILTSEENEELINLFRRLDQFDGVIVGAIDELVKWLSEQASTILVLADAAEWEKANAAVRDSRKQVFDDLRKIAQAVHKMQELQAEFIKVSGAL